MEKKTIINIGRQFGSGGREVALAVGRKLGISVYDNELITKAAEESGFSRQLFADIDEKKSFFSLSSFFSSSGYSLTDNCVGDNGLFNIQSNVIRGIAEKESAVFIGRCSDYILREMKCLDVFITAPEEDRIERISRRRGIGRDEARALMEKTDSKRSTYYNYFTFGDWGVAGNYDLCIDSGILGIEGTADLIVDVAKRMGLA